MNDTEEGGVCAGRLAGDVHVVVQLSPPMVPWSIQRCIVFEIFEDCIHEPLQCSAIIAFGDPLASGLGTATINVDDQCPIERIFAMTALDPLHTLRAAGELMCAGGDLLAVFEGDPADGGSWLIGGNLDAWDPDATLADANSINILDFGIFFSQSKEGVSYPDGNTDCFTPGPHADINGDGLVDSFDYLRIAYGFNSTSSAVCRSLEYSSCPAPLSEITVAELFARGQGELAVADLNQDGRLSIEDMTAYQQGFRPAGPSSLGGNEVKNRTVRRR
jgi:hypothetical protein